jgi:hypothetical protein
MGRGKQNLGQSQPEQELQGAVSDKLLVPTQAELAASCHQWIAAVQLVGAAHVVAAVMGLLLRQGSMALLPHELHKQLAGTFGEAAGAAAHPQQHVQQLGVGAAVLLAVMGAAEVASSFWQPGSSSSSSKKGVAGVQQLVALQQKVLAVELSVCAAAMAAVACLNWALAYVTTLVLIPLAIFCVQYARLRGGILLQKSNSTQDKNSSSKTLTDQKSSSKLRRSRLHCALALLLLGPVGMLMCIALVSGQQLQPLQLADWLHSLVYDSALGTYMMFWVVYFPCWCLMIVSAV